jgi:Ca-activated chloride channel family protein
LATRETALDRDFVLNVRVEQTGKPRAWVEVDPNGQRVAVVSLQPEFESAQGPCEVVFVVDRSGSMQGSSIAEARNALQLCLRSLPAGSHFNIVGFGSRFEMLFPESRAYDERSLSAANDHVSAVDADLGGTEILPALEAVLSLAPVAGLSRQILLLTDGQVTNTQEVITLVRKHSSATRVFAFGIGHGASRELVRGIARAGGGAAEFITPGERLEAKVVRQLGRALAPGLTDLRVDWAGLRVRQAPHQAPPVFAGGRMLIYGFIEDGGGGGPTDVHLRAVGTSGPVAFGARIDPERARAGNLAATLAANAMIRDLEDGVSALHERKGSRQDRGRTDKPADAEIAQAVKAEIVRLGVAYSLCSSATSFVAVEERESPAVGEVQLRRVPIALTHGWGNEEAMGAGAAFHQRLIPMAAGRAGLRAIERGAARGGRRERGRDFLLYDAEPTTADSAPSAPMGPPVRPLDELIALQKADGSWDLSDQLLKLVGLELAACSTVLRAASGNDVDVRRALGTTLALAWLERHASAERDEWSLLARKADAWLAACAARAANGAEWRQVGASLVT